MAKSIRISDELYEQAQTAAALMHRSLNQQIEFWAAIGQMLDKQMSGDELMAAMIKRGHALDEEAVKGGKMRQEDLFVFKKADVKKMDVHFSPEALNSLEL
ncbi:MAG: hypothetical protein HYS18_08015 [Burkholderiales bacterium]|nr:hypothetical protein [Burkholderiales bacterium]